MATAVLVAVARLVLVVAALAFAARPTASAVAAAAGFAIFVVLRAVRMVLRVRVDTELYAGASRAVLGADVLEPAPRDLTAIVANGVADARELAVGTVPAIVGDAVAALVLVPLLATVLPSRIAAVSALAVVAALLVLGATRGMAGKLQRASVAALGAVIDQVVVAIDGRLELVARGADVAALQELTRRIDAYRRTARRSSWRVALLGRAPLAAALAAIGAVVAVDAATRDAVFPFVAEDALVVGACVPVFVSIAVGIHALTVGLPVVEPLAALFRRPARNDGPSAGAALPPLPSPLRLERVAFAYRDGAPVLEGLDATFAPGAIAAVVGANGSGKSTLLKLVLGLRAPSAGRVLVGDQDSAALDKHALRTSIAYLPQRPYLGAEGTTVRAAIHLFEPDASDADIAAAVDRVELTAALAAHDVDPLDTLVDELSAGQRQRLAIARICLRDAAIVLLDEPDANLDAAGIALVARLAKELAAAGKVVVIAAHTEELAALAAQRIELSARLRARPDEG